MPAARAARCAADYQARISGPLLDRIDLQIEVPAVSAADLVLPSPRPKAVAEVRARVAAARAIQAERFAALETSRARAPMPIATGACSRISPRPTGPGARFCARPPTRCSLSRTRLSPELRVARTLADLDGEARVARIHIAEALSYRGETLRRAQAAA